MRRTQPITIGKNSLTTHVQLLQWLHGKQQQQQHHKIGRLDGDTSTIEFGSIELKLRFIQREVYLVDRVLYGRQAVGRRRHRRHHFNL